MSFTGNRGEWSELYVLLRLVSDGVLKPGDKDFKPINGLIYPILEILRTHSVGVSKYKLQDKQVLIESNGDSLLIDIVEFTKYADVLLAIIKKAKASGGSFPISDFDEFLTKIKSHSLTASSSKKTDVMIVIHDPKTGITPIQGFSIKSQLGSPSTLFNASQLTNFVYEIEGLKYTQKDIDRINAIVNSKGKKDIFARLEAICQDGGHFSYSKMDSERFFNNLKIIDGDLPVIAADILLDFSKNKFNPISLLSENVKSRNPLNYDLTDRHPFYELKIRKFLTEVALGMMPSKVWKGKYDATGGYLIIKTSGDIICYHLYDRNLFEEYLFHNTKLETPSTTRNKFGDIYQENGKFYFKLNMQVRFIK